MVDVGPTPGTQTPGTRTPGSGRPRVVLVIGATSGIGLAAARAFAAQGDALILGARSDQMLREAAAACRSLGAAQVHMVAADVTQQDDVDRAVTAARDAHGRLDVVVLTAATMAYGTIETLPPEVFELVVRTAVFGAANVARAVLPVFRRQRAGTLIVVNSLLGSITVPRMGAYSTSKWGQRALVRTLQQELRGERTINVCLVSPGSINTPIYYQAANYLGRTARPPWPVRSPEKVADVVVKLADRPQDNVSVPVGPFNPLIITGFRLFPFIYDRIVGPAFRLAATTREQLTPTAGNVEAPQPQLERMHGRWPDVAT